MKLTKTQINRVSMILDREIDEKVINYATNNEVADIDLVGEGLKWAKKHTREFVNIFEDVILNQQNYTSAKDVLYRIPEIKKLKSDRYDACIKQNENIAALRVILDKKKNEVIDGLYLSDIPDVEEVIKNFKTMNIADKLIGKMYK